jgi:flagellar assembly protein FliH
MAAAIPAGVRKPSFLRGSSVNGRINNAAFRPGAIPVNRSRVEAPQDEANEEAIRAKIAAAAASEVQQLAAQFAQQTAAAVNVLQATSTRLAAEARTDALEIGFLVARRLLDMELSTNPEALVNLVKSAVHRLGETRRIVIHLCPEDARTITSTVESSGSQALTSSPIAHVEIAADAALKRGDCLIEGDQVTVDGRLDARLEELHRLFAHGLVEEAP